MKLYMHPGACSLSPHIVCRELGLAVELVAVDRATHRAGDGSDFLMINGNGYVPALTLDDGDVITEGPAIVQYLTDLRPDAHMAPVTGRDRRRLQSWLNFISTELHKPMGQLFAPSYASARETLLDHVTRRLEWTSKQIQGPYLMGDSFSAADAYLFVCLNWSPWIGVDLLAFPTLAEFMRRVGTRPKVQDALSAEGLSPYGDSQLYFAPALAG